jgi:predicted nucleotidyltransferase component of viral defense system
VNAPEHKNLPASIHDRLLKQARKSGRPLNELLQYYAIERFLYRLTQSKHAEKFILKGALLFRVWGFEPYRPTRDIDLLGFTNNDVASLIAIVKEICDLKVSEDGIDFLAATVTGERIRDNAEYEGVRLRFSSTLGKIQLHLQIDVAFGDVVTPSAVSGFYPTLLAMPAPEVCSYPPETVVAEKLQAMIYLGSVNSRMKDFYDLWVLTNQIQFKGGVLQKAINLTFENRDTDIPEGEPVALSTQFAQEKQGQWKAFLKTENISNAPPQFDLVLARIQEFISPIFEAQHTGKTFRKNWQVNGTWL